MDSALRAKCGSSLELLELPLERVDERERRATGGNLKGLIDGQLLEPIRTLDAQPRVGQCAQIPRLHESPLVEEFCWR